MKRRRSKVYLICQVTAKQLHLFSKIIWYVNTSFCLILWCKIILYHNRTLGRILHFPEDSQSQHTESYNRRSNGALLELSDTGGWEFFLLDSSSPWLLVLGTYANDNLTNNLKEEILHYYVMFSKIKFLINHRTFKFKGW